MRSRTTHQFGSLIVEGNFNVLVLLAADFVRTDWPDLMFGTTALMSLTSNNTHIPPGRVTLLLSAGQQHSYILLFGFQFRTFFKLQP
jgi:hypothetical protein